MSIITAIGAPFDSTTFDLSTILDYTVVSATGNTVQLDGGGGVTVVILGANFKNPDADGCPTEGPLTKVSFYLDGVLSLEIKKLHVRWEDIHSLDGDALRHLVYTGIGKFRGSQFDDRMVGIEGNDLLDGNGGADTLDGGLGADDIYGEGGRDVLTGGGDGDRFHFSKITDSAAKVGKADRITDLNDADVIDIRLIGDYVLVDHFTQQAGQLDVKYQAKQDRTLVMLDKDGDGKADMTIVLDGDHRDFSNFWL